MAQRIEDHCALHPLCPLWLLEQLEDVRRRRPAIGAIFCGAPDLTGPKEAPLFRIFVKVADNIRFLEEGAKRVGQFELAGN